VWLLVPGARFDMRARFPRIGGCQPADPRHLAFYARHHWAIENREHYVRDKTFSEDLQQVRTGNQPSAYAAIRNLVIGAFRRAGFAKIAHARRYHARDDQRILALYGYTRNRHRAHPITNSRQGVSWLALTRSLRRSLARARRSDADVHLLLLAACSDDDRHAGRVIDPVPARDGQPSAAARVGAVADLDYLAGRTRRTPPDA